MHILETRPIFGIPVIGLHRRSREVEPSPIDLTCSTQTSVVAESMMNCLL